MFEQSNLFTDVWSVTKNNGFLPSKTPITSLPIPFHPLERLVMQLPHLVASKNVVRRVESLLVVTPALKYLNSDSAQLERAMLLYAFAAHAYAVEVNINVFFNYERALPQMTFLQLFRRE